MSGAARALPAWPFQALFVAYPLWWLLGLGPIAVFGFGTCAALLLVGHGRVLLPRLWWWWLAFVLWGFASATMLDSTGRLVGFAQRWTSLVGALVLVVYVYNAPQRLTRRRVLASLSVFLGWMALGGYLGLVAPWARVTTPVSLLLPPSLAANSYVTELVSPRFAEVQQPYGAPEPFVRPAAPFPYTNAWGHAFVLLLPVALALAVSAPRRTRLLVLAVVAAAVPPALATLNRGIFVGVGVAGLYVAARRLRHATPRALVGGAVLATALGALVLASGVIDRVLSRTATSSTTQDRADLYREAFTRTLASPLVGWGAPRPSLTKQVSVGTQGHLWYLMFSHGFVGLGLFLVAIWGTAVATRRVGDLRSVLVHTPVVVIGVMLAFYGVDGLHLLIALSCAALLSRPGTDRYAWDLQAPSPPVPPPVAPGSRATRAVSMARP